MSCLAIIRSARDEMSANEKKLADFILENSGLIRDYSSQQLASSVGVSQSSVIKFSQKLGYKGFTDLKLAIHESVVKHGSNVAVLRRDSGKDGEKTPLRDQLFHSKCDALSSTADLNDEELILSVINVIEASDRIQIVATGRASMVAKDLAHKLMILGKPVVAESDTYYRLSGVATLGRGDALILISVSGQDEATVQVAKRAKREGVTIVSLTKHSANPISALADVRLFSVSRNSEADIPYIVASASQQHVVDLIFHALTQRTSQGREMLQKSRRAVEILKAK